MYTSVDSLGVDRRW